MFKIDIIDCAVLKLGLLVGYNVSLPALVLYGLFSKNARRNIRFNCNNSQDSMKFPSNTQGTAISLKYKASKIT